jgi:carboxyl-terminal processing protease
VEIKESYADTKVSLNETVRKKEMEEAELKRGKEKLGNEVITKEKVTASSDLQEIDDEYLREGLFILSDLISSIG